MSLALYRKYRPATFAELKGQEHVAEPLRQALRNGRINHAYLFSGPRGCGKTSSARILARSLNCEQGPTPDPCGKCDSCVALGPSGTGHIDVIEIDAASHGGVDDARDLRERAFFAPVSARFKVYIIDEAHMVTREGFNALLKLVEEPPPHLKFVFATTEPEKVIGTIRSRTHHYPFRLIPPGVLQELVEEILRSEDVPYEPSALPLAVRAGAGSARDTLSILDQLLAGSDEKGITYARAVSLLGYTDSALLDEVIAAFAAGDGAAVFAAIDRVIESGQDPRRFAADLLERVRDLVILSNVPEAGGSGLLNVPPDELEQMRRQASSMGPGELTRAADLLHTGLTEMRGATSPRLLLELICARILLPAAYEDEASLLARLDRLERQASQGGFGAGPGGGPDSGVGPRPSAAAWSGPGGPAQGGPGQGGSGQGGPGQGGSTQGGSAQTRDDGPGQTGENTPRPPRGATPLPVSTPAPPRRPPNKTLWITVVPRPTPVRPVRVRPMRGRPTRGRPVWGRPTRGRPVRGRPVVRGRPRPRRLLRRRGLRLPCPAVGWISGPFSGCGRMSSRPSSRRAAPPGWSSCPGCSRCRWTGRSSRSGSTRRGAAWGSSTAGATPSSARSSRSGWASNGGSRPSSAGHRPVPPSGRPGPSSGFGGAATPNPAPQPRSPARPGRAAVRAGARKVREARKSRARARAAAPAAGRAAAAPDPGPLDESDEVDPEGTPTPTGSRPR
ncbi:DNA polymerase III subunit gamma and tau [Actinomadura madurae]|uniref:DNA polymerase III subunit gamma and tau n=1 Tax=Actinomadura madurae TaxID=1993 RepID=UPI0020D25E01|nr:DNA polymerase III subunit gamma and tau [Actinomadura madurae]MCP9969045.1 DNA polymerase III subunit gamma and tau [Actinomadura madurae]